MRRSIEIIIQLELAQKHLSIAKQICGSVDLPTQDQDEVMTAYMDDFDAIIEFLIECENQARSNLPELQVDE